MGNGSRSHHLLKHALPEVDVKEHFGSIEPKDITREINRLGQRELQAKFRAVYGTQTFSNNNNWLRRKLMEAAGLQTPKAAARGRPTLKQARALSQSDAVANDPLTMSRSNSLGSQAGSGRAPSPPAGVVRRTKRARKPKLYEDMLVLNHGHGPMTIDEDESAQKSSISDKHVDRRPLMPSGSELLWMAGDLAGRSTVLGSCAPSTPEKPLRAKLVPDFLTADQLLGGAAYSKEVGASLPAWARLPSNDCQASGDLDDCSTQDSRSSGSMSGEGAAMSHMSSFESFHQPIAPATPPRMVSSPSSASFSLLHDSPYAAAFGHSITGQPQEMLPFSSTAADFDCFAAVPALSSELSSKAAATAAAGLTKDTKGGCVDFGVADSCASEMSALDLMLEELSSHRELAQDLSQLTAFDGMWDL